MLRLNRRQLTRACRLAACFFVIATTEQIAFGGMFDPSLFSSLGAFPPSADWYVADTDNQTIQRGDGTGDVWHGVLSDGAAVFTFDSISMGSGFLLTVSGQRGIALLSHSDTQIGQGAVIDVSGHILGAGAGGFSANEGPGVGESALGAGGGGGHGGSGGTGGLYVSSVGTIFSGGAGGGEYGIASGPLVGGSGGAGWTPGGGGGAIELSALGTIRVDGLIAANGGAADVVAGGGAGGLIRMQASHIELATDQIVLSARGGNGSSPLNLGRGGFYFAGGGGGGGHILLMAHGLQIGTSSIDVSGGWGNENGGSGVITLVHMPEPSTAFMAILGASGVILLRKQAGRDRSLSLDHNTLL
jgi:hypothetical protein